MTMETPVLLGTDHPFRAWARASKLTIPTSINMDPAWNLGWLLVSTDGPPKHRWSWFLLIHQTSFVGQTPQPSNHAWNIVDEYRGKWMIKWFEEISILQWSVPSHHPFSDILQNRSIPWWQGKSLMDTGWGLWVPHGTCVLLYKPPKNMLSYFPNQLNSWPMLAKWCASTYGKGLTLYDTPKVGCIPFYPQLDPHSIPLNHPMLSHQISLNHHSITIFPWLKPKLFSFSTCEKGGCPHLVFVPSSKSWVQGPRQPCVVRQPGTDGELTSPVKMVIYSWFTYENIVIFIETG